MKPGADYPSVLIIAGLDPSGGAGIQADIQAITAAGAHPAPVISTLTVQDTVNAYRVSPVDPDLIIEQSQTVLDDLDVRAIKVGLLGTSEIAAAVAELLADRKSLPLVLDPVLVAAGGAKLAETSLAATLKSELIPLATVLTPNASEIRSLAPGAADQPARAQQLLESGARYVLAKGGDEDTTDVVNVLYDADGERARFSSPRLPHSCHGSGCTLASAIAARLALGEDVPAAVELALNYTFRTLKRSFRPGAGQYIPERIRTTGDSNNS